MKFNALKKVKILAIAAAMTITMVGCSDDKEETVNETPTNQNTEVENNTENNIESDTEVDTEVEEDTNSNSDLISDLDAITKLSTITFNFIQESSTKISEYAIDNDTVGMIGYCSGITNSDNLESIEGNFNEIYDKLKTDKGRELFSELKSIYDDYMAIMKRMSNGSIDSKGIEMTNALTVRISEFPTKVANLLNN